MEDNKKQTQATAPAEQVASNIIKFKKPYKFEDHEYTEIDLSGIEDMTTAQMIQAERIFERGGAVSALKEMNVEFACIVASMVTDKPVEFFNGLPGREGGKIQKQVSAYFFEQD